MYRLLFPVMGILSLLVIGTGVATLGRGRLGYYNYRHLVVFRAVCCSGRHRLSAADVPDVEKIAG
jgi:hypothetical protein